MPRIDHNPQWELFAREFAKSGRRIDAYLTAYPSCSDRASASSSARKLVLKDCIIDRINELKERMTKTATVLYSVSDRLATLEEIATSGRTPASARTHAIRLYNEMAGDITPAAKTGSGPGQVNVQVNVADSEFLARLQRGNQDAQLERRAAEKAIKIEAKSRK